MRSDARHDTTLLVGSVLLVLICTALLGSTVSRGFAESNDVNLSLDAVRKRIEEKGYSWTADHTSLSHLSPNELRDRMGTRLPENYEELLRQVRSRTPFLPKLDLYIVSFFSSPFSKKTLHDRKCPIF